MDISENSLERFVHEDPRSLGWAVFAFAVTGFWFFVVPPLAYEQNGILAALVVAAGTVVPLIWALLIVRRREVVFDGERRVVTVRRALFESAKGWMVPFDEITALYLRRSGSEGPPSYQLFMGTSAGEVQLSLSMFDRQTAEQALDAAYAFLQRTGASVTFDRKPRILPAMRSRQRDG